MDDLNVDDLEHLVDTLTRDLLQEYGQRVSVEEVELVASQAVRAYAGSRIKTFVPILARREARSRLRRMAAEAS